MTTLTQSQIKAVPPSSDWSRSGDVDQVDPVGDVAGANDLGWTHSSDNS